MAFKEVSKEEAGAYRESRNKPEPIPSATEKAQPVPTPPAPQPSKAESPKIEKAALERDFIGQRYMYYFHFDFVNALVQPIEIISVNVFDMNRQRVEQDWGRV